MADVDWMDESIPYRWKAKHPGLHKVTSYGQTSLDGWHCWGCAWQSGDPHLVQRTANKEHQDYLDRLRPDRPGHHHEDWQIREASDGDHCAACGELVRANYPEHEKLAKVSDQSQKIGEFLDWLGDEKSLRLAEYVTFDGHSQETLVVSRQSTLDLLADFFEIDQNKIEQEKRAMLAKMREMNGG